MKSRRVIAEKCKYCGISSNKRCQCEQKQKPLDDNFDLIVELLNSGYGTYSIAFQSKELLGFKTNNDQLRKFCKRHQLPLRGLKEAQNSIIRKEKFQQTCLHRYGVKNPSSSDIFKKAREETNIKKYGVKNQFQRTEIKEQIPKILFQKYGVYSSLDLSNCINSNGDGSKLHMKISKFLTENKIDHENDPRSKFRKYSAFLGKEYCPKPDILIEDRKLVIEINGTRWHADPKKYSPTDIIQLWIGPTPASTIWELDKNRIEHIESFGYRVKILWQEEIQRNFEGVKSKILQWLEESKKN